VGVVTRRVQWLASLGMVGALAAGSVAISSSASARSRPRHVHVHPVSATPSAPVTTASFDFTVGVRGIGKGLGTITVTGTGQADLVNDTGSLSVTLPASVAALIPGSAGGPEVVNLVLSGGTVYAQIPALATLLGEPWISVALPSSATTAIPGIFTTVGGALGDVNEILAFAQAHHASVHTLKPSTVDGTSVTGSRVSAHVKGLNIVATLWANSSDQLVQARVSGAIGAGPRIGISAVVNFTGYDAPVTVTVPPSSQVRAIPLSVVTSVLGGLFHGLHHGAAKV
jgi:hypothetical protein